jgi:hypothetical protein
VAPGVVLFINRSARYADGILLFGTLAVPLVEPSRPRW